MVIWHFEEDELGCLTPPTPPSCSTEDTNLSTEKQHVILAEMLTRIDGSHYKAVMKIDRQL